MERKALRLTLSGAAVLLLLAGTLGAEAAPARFRLRSKAARRTAIRADSRLSPITLRGRFGAPAHPSAKGISCEDSYPPLTGGVIREELHDLVRDTNKPHWFAYGPNQAVSYAFTAQAGGFNTNEGTAARRTSTLITVSETPCDFDYEKALAGIDRGPTAPKGVWDACRIYNVGPGGAINMLLEGQVLPPGTSPIPYCWLKPGKTYYFNIRSFQADDTFDPNHAAQKSDYRDSCAEDAKNFGFGPGLKCGGIWQFVAADSGVRLP
ncbi:MAG: hypothetical protein HY925_01660 [Elusimicrobia bacterium]|nr:hypothetical protein [Elusimicrobiota bacterium]